MFELPKNCYVNKFLPKKIFYEKVGVSSGVKDEFVNLVDRITWLYKLSPETIGITKTDNIEEIQIFQIDVKERKIPIAVIKTITKGVQYKTLFLIKYNEEFCYSIKVDDIFTTEWNENIKFDFNAINLELVYESIVKTIIKEEENPKKFKTILEEKNIRIDLEKRINQLRQKVRSEKQFNRKAEYNIELNKLIKELEEIDNG